MRPLLSRGRGKRILRVEARLCRNLLLMTVAYPIAMAIDRPSIVERLVKSSEFVSIQLCMGGAELLAIA